MVIRMLLLLWLGLHGAVVTAADITAHVDRNPVAENESFQLTFDVEGSLDDDPDFSPLETYFDILSRSQSNRIQIINGDMQRLHQWQLTLMARKPGRYTIPAIRFGKDRSDPIDLTVNADTTAANPGEGPVQLEVTLEPKQAYVQSQALLTVKLIRSVTLRNASLSEPDISGVETIIEQLREDRNYETLRDGVRYVITERSYTLTPQAAGRLEIAPIVFQGQYLQGNRFSFNETLRSKRLRSEPLRLEVLPIPPDARRPWLPTKELRLLEEWPEDPPRFRVGEPVTRTLTVMASGIAAAQLPALSRPVPDGLKQYPDQPTLQDQPQSNGNVGVRQEKIALMPTRPGTYHLPAIEVPWWNLTTGQQEVAIIPARTINVAGTASEPGTPAPAATQPEVIETAPRAPQVPRETITSPGFWPWLSLALALGWAATGVLWWRQRPAPGPQPKPGTRAVLRAVKQACVKPDPRACKAALLSWARLQWPHHPPTSLAAMADRVDAPLATQLTELNRVLYGGNDSTWDSHVLWQTLKAWRNQAGRRSDRNTSSPLRPLYPGK